MKSFKYTRATDARNAVQTVSAEFDGEIFSWRHESDRFNERIRRASRRARRYYAPLNLTQIKVGNGGVSIGALAKNTDTANHPLIRQNYPLLTQAILAGASAQLAQYGDQRR
jgi:xanthine dehydrogenase YagS FAD-binding subunit